MKGLTPDSPSLSTLRSHGRIDGGGLVVVGDLWMAIGAAYGLRPQHCLSCLGKIKKKKKKKIALLHVSLRQDVGACVRAKGEPSKSMTF